MLQGILLAIDKEKNTGKIQQAVNKREYLFPLDMWDGEQYELEKNAQVEFDADAGKVIKVRPKPKPVDPDEIPVTKPSRVCITEFFERENKILDFYKDFVADHERLDFLRSQRFIMTAYNDLCEIDSGLANDVLKKMRAEILNLYKEYENYEKKTAYSLEYSFEKIFLVRQSAYTEAQNSIERAQSALNNASAQAKPLQKTLEEEEFNLKMMKDKSSSEYQTLDKEIKAMRKRYVDLLNFVAVQKEYVVKTTERMKNFRLKHMEEFGKVFTPMKQDIKDHFITLLDSKAHDLDATLWNRAKHSDIIKRFFRDANITGGYSSKTFLQYFLRGIDKGKLTPKTKEFFALLKYLESVSKRNVMIISENETDANYSKQIIDKVDSCITTFLQQKLIPAFNELSANNYHIVVMPWVSEKISALDFIRKYKSVKPNANTIFILMMPEKRDVDFVIKARDMGITLFVPFHNADLLMDAVRMAI